MDNENRDMRTGLGGSSGQIGMGGVRGAQAADGQSRTAQAPRPQLQDVPAGQQPPIPPCGQPSFGAQTMPPQPPKRKSHGWIVAIVAIVAVMLLAIVSVVSCSSVVSSIGNSSTGYVKASTDSVAVIEIDGTIQYDNTACSPEGLKYLLDEAADDSNIKAVVLRVNSGGGTATAGEEMATYVKQFRQDTGKPVVVSSASMNASAAYEISSQADAIFVAKTTEIGSIGVIMQTTDLSELLNKLGISVDNITSSDGKDSSYGTRALSDDERAYYQGLVNQINDVFINFVADGRNMSTESVRALATGLVFTGQTAVENGLADKLGTREDAIEYAAELAGLPHYETCELRISSDYDLSSLSSLLGSSYSASDLISLLKEQTQNGSTVE